jgi:4-diphosphocytidyl-2-C-methyl-D-erythritol kinase
MVSIMAPAKLTLSLEIIGVRTDGYHLIKAEMVSLDLIDTLQISEGDEIEVQTDYPYQPWEFPEETSVPEDDNNLVAKALTLTGRKVAVRINKRIPPGTGLGGGSSNAAAVLRWDKYEDLKCAAQIGADVPFCINGGRALVSGIGENIKKMSYKKQDFTLLIPPFSCSTKAVYEHWDHLGGPKGDHGNDLEPAATSLYPELNKWRDLLGDATGKQPRLAGSGSTWFVEGAFPKEGLHVVSSIPRQNFGD